MRKLYFISFAVAGILLAACGSNAKVEGTWVQPIPGQDGQVQGVKLEEGGKASSVNMSTLLYETWKQEGTQLILTGQSIGNGQTIQFSDTMNITKLTSDSLVLDVRGYEQVYSREK